MWLELVAFIWAIKSLHTNTDWLNMSTIEYIVALLPLLLIAIIFLSLYKYTHSLPTKDSEVIYFKQQKFKKPILLRLLFAIQIIIILHSAYSTNAWALLYTINLFELQGFYGVFELIVFLSLHTIIIAGVFFHIKLIKLNNILNVDYSEKEISKQLKLTYKNVCFLCITLPIFIIWHLIPKIISLPTFADLHTLGHLSIYIILSNIALAIFLGYTILSIFLRKRILINSNFQLWLTSLLAIDLYITVGDFICSLSLFLELPELFFPKLLYIFLEILLFINLIRLSSYSIITSRFSFLNTATSILQNAFTDDILFSKAFGVVNNKNNLAAKTYFQFSLNYCDRQGDINTNEDEAILGWILGDYFPPTVHDDSMLGYKEIEQFERHEATPERIIAENASNYGYIWLLATAPNARGKGLAKGLIEKTLIQMKELGLAECWLSTENSNNLRFYQKNGFELFAEQVSELNITTYVMVNKLNM